MTQNNQSPSRRLTSKYKEQLRLQAEAAVQYLVDLLDYLSGDPDLEPELSQGAGSDHWIDHEVHWQLPALEGWSGEDVELPSELFSASSVKVLRDLQSAHYVELWRQRNARLA